MSTKKPTKESRLKRCLKAPIRMLSKARDFYIKGMTEWSDQVCHGTAIGCPTGQINNLPRSFSVNSTKSSNNDDDYRELLRFASTRSLSNKVEVEFLRRQQSQKSPSITSTTGPNNMPRSYSVGIGRIDEEKPCDFGEDDKVETTDVFPRSRSHAVSRRGSRVI